VAWIAFMQRDTADFGTGLVALEIARGDTGRAYPLADTLVFRAEPRIDAPMVGALIVERPDPMNWETHGLVPDGTHLNFREYDYEESGVPTDSTDQSGRWVRGILGFSPTKTAVTGWASLDDKRVRALSWADHLAERAQFPIEGVEGRLYSTLEDGKAERGGEPFSPGRHNIEEILERSGQWLRVRIRWPYSPCEGDKTEGTQTRDVWIRYLDARGRPLMFYPTRGC
jgi:hypothetical protein